MGRSGLGLALEQSGAGKEALEHYREALRISPDDRDARAGVRRTLGRE
jgi:cytochrome c-type biogenesis protein CcmH/NrfG